MCLKPLSPSCAPDLIPTCSTDTWRFLMPYVHHLALEVIPFNSFITVGCVSKWGCRDGKFVSGVCFAGLFRGMFRGSVSHSSSTSHSEIQGGCFGVCFEGLFRGMFRGSVSPKSNFPALLKVALPKKMQTQFNKTSSMKFIEWKFPVLLYVPNGFTYYQFLAKTIFRVETTFSVGTMPWAMCTNLHFVNVRNIKI